MNEKQKNWEKKELITVFLILAAGLFLRIILAGLCSGHYGDLSCFQSWADRIVKTGCAEFYNENVFTDYPPGYMYILWIIGQIRRIFALQNGTFANLLLLKSPAIIVDTMMAVFAYRIACKKNRRIAVLSLLLIYLNPALFLNSSIWGQVDVLFTFCVLLFSYLVTEKKLPAAYFIYAIGILIKPQTLIFTPVILYGVWDAVIEQGKLKWLAFSKQSIFALMALISMLLMMMPFGIDKVISQYAQTMTSYPYATVNAYNIWQLFGLNWVSQEQTFLGLPYNKWGSIAIFLIVFLSAYVWKKRNADVEKYFLSAAVIIGGMFLFSVRMHERYLFPIIPLLFLAYIYSNKKQWLVAYLLFSIGHFINVYDILYHATDVVGGRTRTAFLDSAFLLLSFGYFVYNIWRQKSVYPLNMQDLNDDNKQNNDNLCEVAPCDAIPCVDTSSDKTCLYEEDMEKQRLWRDTISKKTTVRKWDIGFILVLSLLYTVIAFYDLGDKKSIESFYTFEQQGDSITFDLANSTYITKIALYMGNLENRNFTLEVAEDAEGPYRSVYQWDDGSVFNWKELTINDKGQYFRLISNSDTAVVGEIMFYDFDGNLVTPSYSTPDANVLYDEQEIYNGRSTFRNGTYFDEIYHARTAYEYIHGLYSYENTHPPLGKIFISLGIRLFGMNPFGWRFMGTLFGVLMIPVFYLFVLYLFKSSLVSVLSTIVFTFDFMHFAQTRIATIDVFVTFFIILMYLFLLRYIQSKKQVDLLLCGISMGFGIACKWTGIYAGMGLCILFFLYWGVRLKKSSDVKYDIKQFFITCACCLIYFVLIPVVIYTLSYLPFRDGTDRSLIAAMLANQVSMYEYHTNINATHPYSSWWYQWPIMYRPIWYYSGTVTDTVKEGISAFGNPLVWWTGIAAFFYCAYKGWRDKDRTAIFLCIGYFAQYLPWFLVTRITFIYHYFPSVPFVVAMIGYCMRRFLLNEEPKRKKWAILYTVATVGLFVMFYPVLSGMPVSESYVVHFLRWFDSWVLI